MCKCNLECYDKGPGFGEFKIDFESIFERMSRARGGTVSSIVIDHGNPANWHGSTATTTIACKTDAEVLDGLLGSIPSHTFAFGRFTAIADALGCKYCMSLLACTLLTIPPAITNRSAPDPTVEGDTIAPSPASKDIPSLLATLDSQLKQLYDSLPARTAVVIFTGHSDPRRMAELNGRKSAFETAIRSGKKPEELSAEARWTSADARELEEEVVKARRGLLFLGVKDTGL